MNITKIHININAMLDRAILVNVSPAYTYENGVKTQKVEGYRYQVVMPSVDFEKLVVRIPGQRRMDAPSEGIAVRFVNPTARLYYNGTTHDITVSADDVKPASSDNKG